MKQILFTTILILTYCGICFGQEPKTRAELVREERPLIMTSADFERLDIPASMDRFGKITDKEKRAHLDRFVDIISPHNTTIEFVIRLNGKLPADVGPKMEFVYRYLIKNRNIAPSRVTFALSAEPLDETELWLIPNKNLSIPSCPDCAIISAEDEKKLNEFFRVKT